MTQNIELANPPMKKWKITFITKHGSNPTFINVSTEEVNRIKKDIRDGWLNFIVIDLDNDAGSEMVLHKDIVGFSVRVDERNSDFLDLVDDDC